MPPTPPGPPPARIAPPWAAVDLASLPRPRLAEVLRAAGLPRFRADQVFRWLHARHARGWAEMSDLPAGVRASLAEAAPLPELSVIADAVSQDGSARLALSTRHGAPIETVIMPMAAGATQCLSSQVGCRMGCTFCATARLPVRANLSAGEIVAQVALACRRAIARGEVRGGVGGDAVGPLAGRPHNLVFMGMGEPFDNYDAVVDAVAILCDPVGFGFSPRRITVSTSGLARRVAPFCAAHPAVNLAWSLTATTDEVRDRLMPVNKGVPIAKMIETLRALPAHPSRRLTFEYALIGGVNDSDADAQRLAAMALAVHAHCNLIPFNAWPGAPFGRPPRAVIARFADLVARGGATVTVRESKGQDIGAACGQLAGAVS